MQNSSYNLMQLDKVFHDLLVGANVSDTKARHCKGFGKAVDGEYIVLHSFERGKALLNESTY